MTIVPTSIIKVYAESIGLVGVSDDVLGALAQDVEYRESSKFMLHSKRQKLLVDDINATLQSKNLQPLYGYDPTEPLNFKAVPNTPIFYNPQEEIDLETLLHEPLPKAPAPMTLTSHWLAIEGVQPAIPENPILQDRTVTGEPSNTPLPTLPSTRKEVLEDAETKPIIKHILSRELQLYYDNIVADLLSEDINKNEAALNSLQSDAGLQQLLPYFVQFVAEMVPKNLRCLRRLYVLMQVFRALLCNKNLFVEPYLHQFMPPLLTCVLGKRLCENPLTDQHWSLRRSSAEIVSYICEKFGSAYTTLIPRVTRTMLKTITDKEPKSLSSQYGAIIGLGFLGPLTIDSVLLPVVDNFSAHLEQVEDSMSDDLELRNLEISKIRDALKECAEKWLTHFEPLIGTPASPEDLSSKVEFMQKFIR